MTEAVLTDADRRQLEGLGITEKQVLAQLRIFKKPPFSVRLVRNCTVGDGVIKIDRAQAEHYANSQRKAAGKGRFLKFVPASGAATRMFKELFEMRQRQDLNSLQALMQAAAGGDPTAEKFKRFLDNLPKYAFHDELQATMARDGLELQRLINEGRFEAILTYLLAERGLNYGSLAKGLLKFHRYPTGGRTAFEEHLIEAVEYARDADGVCRLHFTILPEHRDRFDALLAEARRAYEQPYGVRFEVGFSYQKASTDTIAADLNNEPFRDPDGRLVFRPGGHGALLDNLAGLREYLVYIKNIDNVVPDRLKAETYFWKHALGGLLVETESSVHGLLRRLKVETSPTIQAEAETLAREKLCVAFPDDYSKWPSSRRRSYLWSKLNRPIRVCGVVRNVGEPGGAPFWVAEADGSCSIQIVEKAQVNFAAADQEALWNSSTHFNPVDLVCCMRDFEGNLFDLDRYANPDAVFISKKSSNGRELKALELPGLWNGGMADWITLCVEVPIITFNPVKTVDDLLRSEHQPGD